MFCPECGTIIGRDAPADLYGCPRCAHVIKVQAFAVVDEVTTPRFVPVEGGKKRLVGLFVSEAMIRFLLSNRTSRAALWEPLLSELEEERLKVFAKGLGWILSRAFRDKGPSQPEAERPFQAMEQDLKEGLVNAFLVSDFDRVPRRDLFRMHELAEAYGVPIYSVAPHPCDPNLAFDNIDYDAVPLSHATNPVLDRHVDAATVAELTGKAMARFGWLWTYYIADLVANRVGVDKLKAWRADDPTLKDRGWKDVLTYVAIARARGQGALDSLPLPRLGVCELCKRRFLDTAMPLHLAELARFEATYCRNCLARAFFFDERRYGQHVGPAEIDSRRDFEAGVAFIQDLPRDRFAGLVRRVNERLAALTARGISETPSTVWLEAWLGEGELKAYGEVARSDRFWKAADGHLLPSLGAALIDNFLAQRSVPHRLEVKYPRNLQLNPANSLRSDFLARDVHVEFLGMRGQDEFAKNAATRADLAHRMRLGVVGLYAEDLLSPEVMNRKCEPLFKAEEGAPKEEAT